MGNRIRNIDHFRAFPRQSKAISDASHSIDRISLIVTRIELESGVIGESNLLAFDYSLGAIAGALHDVAALAMEFQVWETGRFRDRAFGEAEYFGSVGLNRWAVGAINIAMWDAWGKLLGQPVWKMLGAYRDRVAIYGSGGWLSYSIEELLEEATGYVKRGFRAVKVKVGSSEIERDVERIARVREAVGPSVNIMMDANQGMTVISALALARRAQQFNIVWFEEPIARTDFDGYTYLRRMCEIPLAMGEREFDATALRELIRHGALDIWQPDILRLGGVEGWRESALLANAYNIVVQAHYYKEYDVALSCTIPNANGCESFDWIDSLIDHPIEVHNGFAHPLRGPGWGFHFKDDYLTPLEESAQKRTDREAGIAMKGTTG